MTPLELLQHWRDAISAGEEALSRSNWSSLFYSIESTYTLLTALESLDPLTTLEEHGKHTALALAEHQNPGRRWIWQFLIALALTNRGDHTAANEVIEKLYSTRPRVPFNTEPFLAPLLPQLYAIAPKLPLQLSAIHFEVYNSLKQLGAVSEEDLVLHVARLLEQSDLLPQWDEHLIKGAAVAQREELVHAAIVLFERTYAYYPPVGQTVTRTPESRRQQALRMLEIHNPSYTYKSPIDISAQIEAEKTDVDRALDAIKLATRPWEAKC